MINLRDEVVKATRQAWTRHEVHCGQGDTPKGTRGVMVGLVHPDHVTDGLRFLVQWANGDLYFERASDLRKVERPRKRTSYDLAKIKESMLGRGKGLTRTTLVDGSEV